MATQKITTRIKNKIDSLESWVASNPILLNGEIAIIKVATGSTFVNSVTGQTETVYELLMKIGNGTASFDQLPWLSSKASDVFDWGKLEDPEDIPITILVGSTETDSTLGAWLKSINDKASTNASNISSVSAKVDVAKVSTAISTAINALDSTVSGSGNFVKAVTQTNGVVAVTKGSIAASDIPELAASKIVVTTASTGVEKVTLDDKITDIDAAIAALEVRKEGHLDSEITTLISNQINELAFAEPEDSTATTSDTVFIDSISQTNGRITATKKTLPVAGEETAGIVTLGVSGGAASHDSLETLADRVEDAEADIVTLQTAVAGGVHFIGIVVPAIQLSDGCTTNPVTIMPGKQHTAQTGDVVLWNNKEFIWTGSAWEELGDLTRVGALETVIAQMVNSDDEVSNQFVTAVEQTAGKITVSRAQPTSANIKHDDSTVSATLQGQASKIASAEAKLAGIENTVTEAITAAVEALEYTSPQAGSTTTTAFIDTISQTDGKISATKKAVPTATTSVKGIVQLSNSTSSTSETTAATTRAVSSAFSTATDAQSRAMAIESNYVKFNSTDNKLYVGTGGVDEIIFDCGGADV